MKIGCVLLAAGAGVRFGGNKLKTRIADKTFLERILSILPVARFDVCTIVAANGELLCIAQKNGVPGVINDRPELGIARSIRMGLETLADMDACMFCVCDQPFLKGETIIAMLDSYQAGTILSLSYRGKRGNPVIFPHRLFGDLLRLGEGESGKNVIASHPEMLRLHDIADPMQLMDVDTKEQLARIEKLLSGRGPRL